ncbi:DUF485 domain-containing protein [Peribacillus simplex]|uniref:Membrane spanning protein n=1 Tax=Peribacillus simplex TaxID=1478 RepID=A0AAN2PCE1_9BACI|nr:DUF485 domain-containing protein [Peribacillus simplex]NCT35930.1 DUF485 domain-containing protein [Peribacillus frigoritolerans]PRA92714.1 DUF485 domain-containing protein [Peribacillus simplex]CEG30002.1 putative membrane spanning protein [Peribacillus simplex]
MVLLVRKKKKLCRTKKTLIPAFEFTIYSEKYILILLSENGNENKINNDEGGTNLASNDSIAKETEVSASTDYTKIVQSQSFQELLRKKRNFIVPLSIFFMVFYFTLPILTSYSKVLNSYAFGAISWAWIFAFAQFIMTWTLCILYSRKAATFDKLVEKIVKEAKG